MTKNENMNVKAPWIDHLDGILYLDKMIEEVFEDDEE